MRVGHVSFFRNKNLEKNSGVSTSYQSKPLKNHETDSVKFLGLLPKNAKIKLAIFDIDETLKHWKFDLSDADGAAYEQPFRNVLFSHLKEKNIKFAYSSDRGYEKIVSLIKNNVLAPADYIIGNNGGTIFKNVDGEFQEVTSWAEKLKKSFPKGEVHNFLVDYAKRKENMFAPHEINKIAPEDMPLTKKEFWGSKISEYDGNLSQTSVRLVLAPNIKDRVIPEIENGLMHKGITSTITHFHYPKEYGEYEGLRSYFNHDESVELVKLYKPRLYPDGTYDSLLISANNKGMASEHLRKSLGLKKKEVFAVGDGENDFSNANKGYYFALISNATNGLKKLVDPITSANIIKTEKPGVEGVIDVLV